MSKSEKKIYDDFISNISTNDRQTLNVSPNINLYDTLIPSELKKEKANYHHNKYTYTQDEEKINLRTNICNQNSIIESYWTQLNVQNKDYLFHKRISKYSVPSVNELVEVDGKGKLFQCSEKMKEYLKYSNIMREYRKDDKKLKRYLKYFKEIHFKQLGPDSTEIKIKEECNYFPEEESLLAEYRKTKKPLNQFEPLKKYLKDAANVSFLKKLFFLVLFCIDMLETDMKGVDKGNVANDNIRSGGDLVEIKVLPIFQDFARSIFKVLEKEFNMQ